MKVYIVAWYDWEEHHNHSLHLTEEAANAECLRLNEAIWNSDWVQRTRERTKNPDWKPSGDYSVEEYEVQE